MAVTYQILAQALPVAATNTTLYTVPAITSAILSTLSICNQNTSTQYSIYVTPSGATLNPNNAIVFNSFLEQYDSIFLTIGISMATGDFITVSSLNGNVSFSAFGSQLT